MKKLRGVCVGAGYFSRYHLDAWARIPEVEIAALVDRDVARAQQAAAPYGIARVEGAEELARLLREVQPDFVDLITPPETHLELVTIAAASRAAIICQKPLAPTWEQSLEVVAAARATGARFMVHENWRWQPWYREIRRQIEAGTLGNVFTISVRMRTGDGWAADAYLGRQPFFRTATRLLIHETGVHYLDVFRFLGGEVSTVFARLQKRNAAIAGEDAGQIVCGFANGATAILDASRYNEADTTDPRFTFGTVRIDGSRGHIELDTEGRLGFKPLGEPVRELAYACERRGFAGDSVYALQRHFVARLLDGGKFESTGEDYLRTTALVEACYRSHTSGAVVSPEPVTWNAPSP